LFGAFLAGFGAGALEAGGGAVATLFEPCVEVLGQGTSNTLVIFIKVCGRGTGETCARIQAVALEAGRGIGA